MHVPEAPTRPVASRGLEGAEVMVAALVVVVVEVVVVEVVVVAVVVDDTQYSVLPNSPTMSICLIRSCAAPLTWSQNGEWNSKTPLWMIRKSSVSSSLYKYK